MLQELYNVGLVFCQAMMLGNVLAFITITC